MRSSVEAKEEARRYTDVIYVSIKQDLTVEVRDLKMVAQEEVRACREELATLQQAMDQQIRTLEPRISKEELTEEEELLSHPWSDPGDSEDW